MTCRHRHDHVPPTGLTVLFEPDKPSLDIVFVHGFTGHPERTWTHQKGDPRSSHSCPDTEDESEPPSKIRKLNLFASSRDKSSSCHAPIYWPRDLVPETLPYARVLTYGYDTRVSHAFGPSGNRSSVYEMAWDFLVELEAGRRTDPARPLLFIAHSLGGIFVKEALRRSASCQLSRPHRSIFDSTIGIIFFGTPHGGADPRGFLHRVAEKVVKAAGFSVNEQVVNTLLPSAERLRELRDEFNPVVSRQNWTIYSFQEATGVTSLGGEKVVEDTSSYLNLPGIETTQHIGRNHMEMCRFTGFDDPEFKKVAAALGRTTENLSQATGAPSQTTEPPPALSNEKKRMLLDSLRFDQVDSRWMSIKTAHARTCGWLLKKPEYLDWLNPAKLHEHHGFLWLKGKPGTGKSTLMKYALASFRKSMRGKVVISFFFNARGADLEKSTIGMYRSLLLQLLERLPQLQDIFEPQGFTDWNTDSDHSWSIESLKDLFQKAVQSLGQNPVACFIDALDECDQAEVRDMVAFFQVLGDNTISDGIRFQVFFSSRHYPHITISRGLSFVLEGQEGHDQDITDYIDSELRIDDEWEIDQTTLAKKIRADLQEKSAGVFMWVVLVVGILNQEHDEGAKASRLQQKLNEIPGDLYELFRDILTRDSHNKDRLLLCIQWVLFARRPLSPTELYFAIQSGTEPEDISPNDSSEMPLKAIKRFILNSSKGLAEVTQSKIPIVQFIHESVRDFLLKESGLRAIWSDLGTNFVAQSHDRLKQCCLAYIGIDIAAHCSIVDPLPKPASTEGKELRQMVSGAFPFLEYAVENLLWHADTAQAGEIYQGNFLREFDLTKWIKTGNIIQRFHIRRHKPTTSLLYILGEYDMPALIRVYYNNRHAFVAEDERYGPPIFAALACESRGAVTAMLEALERIHGGSSLRSTEWGSDKREDSTFGRDFSFTPKRGVFFYLAMRGDPVLVGFAVASGVPESVSKLMSWAAENGHEAIVQLLLDRGAPVNLMDTAGRRPLSWAAGSGHEAIVQLLLDRGAAVDLTDIIGWAPLSCAAENGHEAIVQLLLDRGAAVNGAGEHIWTPLSCAAQNGCEAIVQLLLDRGAAVDLIDEVGRTPVIWAAENSHEAIVRLLLGRGVAVKPINMVGRTPLSWAAGNGHEAIVQLLLDRGAAVDMIDKFNRTPLSWAAGNGHETIVQLLLDRGAVADMIDKFNRTPLGWASVNGHEAVVQLLHDRGATVYTESGHD